MNEPSLIDTFDSDGFRPDVLKESGRLLAIGAHGLNAADVRPYQRRILSLLRVQMLDRFSTVGLTGEPAEVAIDAWIDRILEHATRISNGVSFPGGSA